MDNTPDTSNLSNVGATLRAAREEQGLAVADIAARIKFSTRQVEALEAGELNNLPEGAFLRGFIRSYARTVQLDEVALVASLSKAEEKSVGNEAEVSANAVSPKPENSTSASKTNVWLMGAGVAVALLAIFIVQQPSEPDVTKLVVEDVKLPEIAVSAVTPDMATSSVVIATPEILPPLPSKAASSVAVVPVPLVKEVKPPVAVKPATPPIKETVAIAPPVLVKPKTTDATPAPLAAAANTSEIPLEQLKKRPLHIVFTGDSWLEVVDKNGNVLISRSSAAGSEKWIGGRVRAPYKIAIGNAANVKMFYKGREVDLSQYKQAGITRLELQ